MDSSVGGADFTSPSLSFFFDPDTISSILKRRIAVCKNLTIQQLTFNTFLYEKLKYNQLMNYIDIGY